MQEVCEAMAGGRAAGHGPGVQGCDNHVGKGRIARLSLSNKNNMQITYSTWQPSGDDDSPQNALGVNDEEATQGDAVFLEENTVVPRNLHCLVSE